MLGMSAESASYAYDKDFQITRLTYSDGSTTVAFRRAFLGRHRTYVLEVTNSMYTNRRIFLLVLCLSFILAGCLCAEEIENDYIISKPRILHRPPLGVILPYDAAEIFVDRDNHIMAASSHHIDEADEHKVKLLLFVCAAEDQWVHTELIEPGFPEFGALINNGFFQAYGIRHPQWKENLFKLSIYSLTNNIELPSCATRVIQWNEKTHILKKEVCGRTRKILPVTGEPNNLYMIGDYTEYARDPFSIARALASGGHAGFNERPYIAKIENGSITEYHNLPVKLKDRECMRYLGSIVRGEKIHVIWRKYREYGSLYDPEILLYSCFDCRNRKWAKTTEPFVGYKYDTRRQYHRDVSGSLNGDGKNVYCACYRVIDEKKHPSSAHRKESAICFSSMSNNQWSKPVKIVDTDYNCVPRVVIDNNGNLYVFWVENDKGLFFMRKDDAKWGKVISVIEHKRLSGYPSRMPFDIAVDKDNNLHIIYILLPTPYCSDPEKLSDRLPYRLAYIKITPVE